MYQALHGEQSQRSGERTLLSDIGNILLSASGHASKYIVQDLLLPRKGVRPFVSFVNERFGFWPLWLCPLRRNHDQPISLRPRVGGDVYDDDDKNTVSFVNVGVWGPGSTNISRFVAENRELEHRVRQLGGIKWLYAQAYYTEDEWNDIYDVEW